MPWRVLPLFCLPLLLACEVRGADTLAPGAPCDPAGPNRCEGPDAGCLALDDDAGVCTRACRLDAECPAAMTCQLEPGGASARCAPGFRCATATDCPAGHQCDAAAGTCFIPVHRGLCSPCAADAQCPAGGRCVEALATGERYCSAPCDDGACPDGYACETYRGSAQCLPLRRTCEAGRPLCAPCTGDPQCGDGNDLCVENFLSRERFCGVSCNPSCDADPACTSVCPENFRCADLAGDGSGPFQCVPTTGSCEGWCAGDEACAIGQTCDREDHLCVPATDGRPCAPCADDDDCGASGSRCVAGGEGAAFCAPPCDDCPLGFVCVGVGEGEDADSVCVPASGSCTSGEGRLGASCGGEGAAGCLSGVCLQAGVVEMCSGRCIADADCGDAGFRCCAVVPRADGTKTWDCGADRGGESGVCAPLGGTFGEPCDAGRPPCQDGHCLDLGASRLCTASCDKDDDCDFPPYPRGSFACRTARDVVQGGVPAGPVRVCFPTGGGETGSDCTFGPAACAERLCIKKASGNVCTHPCGTSSDCPAGWSCGETATVDGQRPRVCLPPTVGG